MRQRKVFTVGAAYTVIAWLLLEVASTVFPIFDAPGWVLKVVTAMLVLGFPVAVLLAWAYELTPQGVVRTDSGAESEEEPGPEKPQPSPGRPRGLVRDG